MKSKIKKEQVLKFLMDKLNGNYYGVPFYMGIDGLPVYKPLLDENGNITDIEIVDEETYEQDFISKVPVSVMVSNGDYSTLKDLTGNGNDVNGASFSATLGFLLQVEDTKTYKVMLEAVEQVRDEMLGGFFILKAVQYNFANDTKSTYPYLVATHCDDIQVNYELELNGKRYLQYTLSVDLDISENISYGNQYEWYATSYKKVWTLTTADYYTTYVRTKFELDQRPSTVVNPTLFPNVDDYEYNTAMRVLTNSGGGGTVFTHYRLLYTEQPYERIMPLIASWGSAQALSGFQMLRNNLFNEEEIKRAKMIHSVASTRGWAITLTLQMQDSKNILVELYRETLPTKDNLQLPYKVKAVYKKMTIVGDEITFTTYDKMGFELKLIPQDSGVSSVLGDNIVFTISLSPFWGDVNG